jgi:hypothetical protein
LSRSYRIEDQKIKGKREHSRPEIERPERRCLCGRGYRYAWSWALILPARTLIDLCAHCSRTLRYGGEDERREMADKLARAGEWRLAA